MVKKIVTKIEDTVEDVVEEIKEEANEEVGTVTFKRWQVLAAAAVVTLVLLAIAL